MPEYIEQPPADQKSELIDLVHAHGLKHEWTTEQLWMVLVQISAQVVLSAAKPGHAVIALSDAFTRLSSVYKSYIDVAKRKIG